MLEGNMEGAVTGKSTEFVRNLEAERPLDGIEQPFNVGNILEKNGFESVDMRDSDRVEAYLVEPTYFNKHDDVEIDNYLKEDADNMQQNDLQEVKNRGGLTNKEKQALKERINWADEIIDCISSMKEAEIYEKAGLQMVEIDGKSCLIRGDIDLNQADDDGISNGERMKRGRSPINREGKEIELHHIGQKQDSPLAELTMEEHRGVGNDTILHDKAKESEIDRTAFAKERKEHWKLRVNC